MQQVSEVINGLVAVSVGMILVGRYEGRKSSVELIDIDAAGDRVRVKHLEGGKTRCWMTGRTLFDRYTLPENTLARVAIGGVEPPPRAAANQTQTEIPAAAAPQPEPSPEVSDDAEPVNTVTPGVELTLVNDWNIYTHKASKESTVRDLDIAKRAGLARPSNIRTVIKALVDAGEVELIPEGGDIGAREACANLSPRVYEVKVTYVSGKGRKEDLPEYHLNELASLLLVFRLQTEKAKALRLDVARTFLLVREGRFEEAARVATGKATAPPLSIEAELAAIDRLLAEGVISSKTAAVHHALAVSRATGFDLTKAPNVTFGEWSPPSAANTVAEAISRLPEGGTLQVSVPVDLANHVGAKEIGKRAEPAVDGKFVNEIARALGVYNNPKYGKTHAVGIVGNTFRKDSGEEKTCFWYNSDGDDLVYPWVEDLALSYRERQRGQTWADVARDVCARISAGEPCKQPTQEYWGRPFTPSAE